MSDHPRCAAFLQGGKRCCSVALMGEEFCHHHLGLVPAHGAEALKRGEHLPRRRRRAVQEPALAETTGTMVSDGEATIVDPASVRPRLKIEPPGQLDPLREWGKEVQQGTRIQRAREEHGDSARCGASTSRASPEWFPERVWRDVDRKRLESRGVGTEPRMSETSPEPA